MEYLYPDAFLGGTNPALRTFYYRLLRLISLCIQPLFVFDGPNKPPFKRNKRTGSNVASIPEYLAKELLKQFGLPYHLAPGEAEAECALLQREGLVDAVLSEDVDTLMFGSGKTMRNWSSEVASNKIPTHVNLYDAETVKDTSGGMDKDGMVLVALMSGGDYVPQGIAGCGPKTACEAAKAGFGRELCQIPRKDKVALERWREKLSYELRTNESRHFRSKHKALKISPEFPDKDVLGYYIRPVISSPDQISKLRTTIEWQQEPKIDDLRTFTAEAFDWRCISGAKKFIRNLAPVLLIRALTKQSKNENMALSDNVEATEKLERNLVQSISGKRTHQSTDNTLEFRIGFIPVDLVPIDLEAEPPDEPVPGEIDHQDDASDSATDAEPEHVADKSKEKRPFLYDPYKLEKLWIPETYVKVGVPLTVQDWEESFRNPKKYQAMKSKNKEADTVTRRKRPKANAMRQGAIKQYASVKKSISRNDPPKDQDKMILDCTSAQQLPSTKQSQTMEKTVIDLLSSPAPVTVPSLIGSPSPTIKRVQRSSFQRTQTLPTHFSSEPFPQPCHSRSSPIPSLDLACSPVRKCPRDPSRKRMRAGCDDSHIPSSNKLDSWLQKSQTHSNAIQTPNPSIQESLPKTALPTRSSKHISNPLQDSTSTNIPKKPNPGSSCFDFENQSPDTQLETDEYISKAFLGSKTQDLIHQNSRKQFVYPRRSLKGVWKVIADVTPELQIVDLTTENIVSTGQVGKKERRKKAWRASQIDVLDMTDS